MITLLYTQLYRLKVVKLCTYCTYFPRKRGLVKPSFMAPPEPLDKSLAKTLVADR